MHTPIESEGFDEQPDLERELIAFIADYCEGMTLAQARGWYEEAFAVPVVVAS